MRNVASDFESLSVIKFDVLVIDNGKATLRQTAKMPLTPLTWIPGIQESEIKIDHVSQDPLQLKCNEFTNLIPYEKYSIGLYAHCESTCEDYLLSRRSYAVNRKSAPRSCSSVPIIPLLVSKWIQV